MPPQDPPSPPPRAFAQGVGTVFQIAGVTMFLLAMFSCCIGGFLGREGLRKDLAGVGWHRHGDPSGRPFYSQTMAFTLSLAIPGVAGVGLAGIGLGLQAQKRSAPWGGVILTSIATAFWIMQVAFAITAMRSVIWSIIFALMALVFAALAMLAIGALREMLRDPPPVGIENLPGDYQIPYSHLHQHPPELRDLPQRRQQLEDQQKELDQLEQKLRDREKE